MNQHIIALLTLTIINPYCQEFMISLLCNRLEDKS